MRPGVLALATGLILWGGQAVGAQSGSGFTTFSVDPCRTDLWSVSQVGGWQATWPGVAESQPVDTPEERRRALERWRELPVAVDQEVAVLKKGLREGYSAARPVIRRVVTQLDSLLAMDPGASPLWSPARRGSDPDFTVSWEDLVRDGILPALSRYRAFLAGPYLSQAREEPGVHALPGGRACHRELVRRWTTLTMDPEEIRRRGLAELDRLEAKLRSLVEPELADAPLPEILDRIRTDTTGAFRTRAQVADHARAVLERAGATLGEWFYRVPETPLEVRAIPGRIESSTPAAFYSPSGSVTRPAFFMVKTSRPRTRRLMSEVVAFHEGIPGHHLQMALARESGTPGSFNSGYVEGWAHYAQRLAEEMGLYSGTRDRIGLVAQNLWSASRTVVEVGVHADGWTRERAVAFYEAHTALPEDEIQVEVDRILALPGQGVAYLLGYQVIAGLREEAREALGDDFDIREFHRVVLEGGSRPLADVKKDVRAWLRSASGS